MEKREKLSKIIFVFFMFFLVWILLQFISPLVLPSNSVTNLSGSVGISDNKDVIEKMPQPMSFVYAAGDILCHQKSERSFFINGNQMPFCSRCTAIWLGLAIGMCFMLFCKIEFNEKFFFLVILGIIPMGIDGVGQLFGFWTSTNITRLLTGLSAGVVCGIIIGQILDEVEIAFQKKKKRIKKGLW